MDDVKTKSDDKPGEDESKSSDALIPEVVDSPGKKSRYAPGSRKGKGGRPVANPELDRPVVVNFIAHLIKRNTSDREIARLVNCPIGSFMRWKKKNIELWNTPPETDTQRLENVKRSAYERATGCWIERPIYDKTTGQIKGTKFQYYPPTDSGIQYYLNNRDPANWKSKVEHNHALEELPVAINFVRASDKRKEIENKKDVKAVTDDYGNLVKISDDENQGNS